MTTEAESEEDFENKMEKIDLSAIEKAVNALWDHLSKSLSQIIHWILVSRSSVSGWSHEKILLVTGYERMEICKKGP